MKKIKFPVLTSTLFLISLICFPIGFQPFPAQHIADSHLLPSSYLFHVLVENGLIYLASSETDFGRLQPYSFLNEVTINDHWPVPSTNRKEQRATTIAVLCWHDKYIDAFINNYETTNIFWEQICAYTIWIITR